MIQLSSLTRTLGKKGILVSYDEADSIKYWPARKVTVSDREWMVSHKAHILLLLQGRYEVCAGDPVSTLLGNRNVWETYVEHDRLGLVDGRGLTSFHSYSEIASFRQHQFFKRRFMEIEVIAQDRERSESAMFDLFKFEWSFLVKELERQIVLLERWKMTNRTNEKRNVRLSTDMKFTVT